MCGPHYVNYLWIFSVLQLFDFLASDIFDQVNVFSEYIGDYMYSLKQAGNCIGRVS